MIPAEQHPRRSLCHGARLGAYEIESLRGTGGMGEVYRARDTRLDRTVAIKVLPAHVAGNPARRQRFEREARAISQLNHPHICALYDVGDAAISQRFAGGDNRSTAPETPDTLPFLVMEYLEGQTLAERLKRGPLPKTDAVRYATEIADALDVAHRRGIVHRDLKPGNVMLTKAGAKLLDFGLARTPTRQLDSAIATDMPSTLTGEGVILGTLPYMAPELLEGRDADARSDLFAFGAVLYEMLTGRRAFVGNSESAVVAAILDSQPAALQTGTATIPPALAHLVTTCLAKDPDERWQSAGDLRRQLEWIASGAREVAHPPGSAKASQRASWMWQTAAVVLFLTSLGLSLFPVRQRPPVPTRVSFQVAPVEKASFVDPGFALSPDGRTVAYTASSTQGSGRYLWVHSFETGEPRMLTAAGASVTGFIVWSPDGRSLAFTAEGKLKKIAVAGGSPQTLVDSGSAAYAWSAEDLLLVASRDGVMRVPAAGGTPTALTALDASRHEIGHSAPRFLPDGKHFLYLRQSLVEETSGIYVGSVDAKPDEQDLTRLIATRGVAVYAPSADDSRAGHVLFNKDETLVAQRFDADALELNGEAFPVAESLLTIDNPSRAGAFSVSGTGTLAYRQAELSVGTPVWVSRDGAELMPLVEAPLPGPGQVRLSPDGTRLAVIVEGDIWVYDLAGRPPIKLTSGGGIDMPFWSRDSRDIVYGRTQPPFRLFSIRADVRSTPTPASPLGHYHPHGWSSDGRSMVAALSSYTPTGYDILKVPWRHPESAEPLIRTSFNDGIAGAALSPNGQWLAYTQDGMGPQEIWVAPYAGSGTPVRISAKGGVDPLWSRDGSELYFVENLSRLMVVAVQTGPTFNYANPRLLFEYRYPVAPFPNSSYDVAADGRFLMIKAAPPAARTPITVVMNWASNFIN